MNWKWLKDVLVIALIALIGSACSSSRQVSSSATADVRSEMSEVRDSVKVEREVVAVHDTLTVTTTITIRENERGDTVRMSVVTDRDRSRSMADVRSKKEEVRMVRDTVYVAIRDSASVRDSEIKFQGSGTKSNFVLALKFICWILVCVIILVIFLR